MEDGTVFSISCSTDCQQKRFTINKRMKRDVLRCLKRGDEINQRVLPPVPEHPAFPASPAHLDRCAAPRSHRVWVKSSRSSWRRRPLLSGTPLAHRPGSEVSKPRRPSRSGAGTARAGSPTWPRRPCPRTWRSSASLRLRFCQPGRVRLKPARSFVRLRRARERRPAAPNSFKSAEFIPSHGLHKSGPISAETPRDVSDEPR